MVRADVLVERGFGLEGRPAGIVAVPALKVWVLGGLYGVGGAYVLALLVVDCLDVNVEVVFSIEDAVAALPWAGESGLVRWVGVDRLVMAFKVGWIFELGVTEGASWLVEFAHVGRKRVVGCER